MLNKHCLSMYLSFFLNLYPVSNIDWETAEPLVCLESFRLENMKKYKDLSMCKVWDWEMTFTASLFHVRLKNVARSNNMMKGHLEPVRLSWRLSLYCNCRGKSVAVPSKTAFHFISRVIESIIEKRQENTLGFPHWRKNCNMLIIVHACWIFLNE